ncbi:MAG: hypothetical protein ACYTG4_08355 [Planctomycetota bacterium]|jgi:hypothetical protein
MEVPDADSTDGPYFRALPQARVWHCWFCRVDFTPHAAYGAGRPDDFVDLSTPGAEWLGRWWHWGCFPAGDARRELLAIQEQIYGYRSSDELWWCRACGGEWTAEEQREGELIRLPVLTTEADHPLHRFGHRYVHLRCLPGWDRREPIHDFVSAIRYPTAIARWTLQVLRQHRPASRFHCYLGAPILRFPDGLPEHEDSEAGKNRLAA